MTKQVLWIIGLDAPAQAAVEVLNEAGLIFARGNLAARWLDKMGCKHFEPLLLPFEAAAAEDYLTEKFIQSDAVITAGKTLAYVTLAVPLSADALAARLLQRYPEAELHWLTGADLTAVETVQRMISRGPGLTILDGLTLAGKYHIPFDASQTTLIYYPDTILQLADLMKLLTDVYPKDHPLQVLFERADGQIIWNESSMADLEVVRTPVAALLIPRRAADSSMVSFEELIAHLRSPQDGCPWDKKQTHASLRTYLLEETYEALDDLDKGDMEGLKEELGDILLQVTLHSQIAVENHEFNLAEVLEGINRKLVFRHPHIFGEASVEGEQGVLQNWEKLKQQERAGKNEKSEKGLLEGIPISFPALAQAQSIQDRAARVGFDWKEIGPVIDKVFEEFDEVKTAPDEMERAKELGDLLFAVVNLVRWYHVDAESALRGTNLKFRRRFAYIEQKSRELQKPLQEMTLAEMDGYWDEAKKAE